jgi:Ca2+-binding EF-hand superfamily protein
MRRENIAAANAKTHAISDDATYNGGNNDGDGVNRGSEDRSNVSGGEAIKNVNKKILNESNHSRFDADHAQINNTNRLKHPDVEKQSVSSIASTEHTELTGSDQLRSSDPWQKCQVIFAQFDKDKDGLLNFQEMRDYTSVTEGGENGSLLRSTWNTLCKRKGVDPELGFACEDLFKIYHVAVDKDLAQVFHGRRQNERENAVRRTSTTALDGDEGHEWSLQAMINEMNLHAKIQYIFEEFDKDKDNYMNLNEMNAFTTITEGEQEQLTREEWEHTCRRMLIDPDIGLAFNDLATIYTTHLDKDFETVLGVQLQARTEQRRKRVDKEVQDQLWKENQLQHGMP